jgi:hypothetical protein
MRAEIPPSITVSHFSYPHAPQLAEEVLCRNFRGLEEFWCSCLNISFQIQRRRILFVESINTNIEQARALQLAHPRIASQHHAPSISNRNQNPRFDHPIKNPLPPHKITTSECGTTPSHPNVPTHKPQPNTTLHPPHTPCKSNKYPEFSSRGPEYPRSRIQRFLPER